MLKVKLFSSLFLIIMILLIFGCGEKPERIPLSRDPGPQGKLSDLLDNTTQPTGGEVNIGRLKGKVPSGWVQVEPQSRMRQAQFVLNSPNNGVDPGELTVFYFGPDAGGVEANLQRWYGQFASKDNTPISEKAKREEILVDSMKVILVSFTGTMKASTMPGMPQQPERANMMNFSAIIMTPDGPWFFKGTGPQATMEYHAGKIREFIVGMEYK
ncbi:hypothetical protein K8I28_09595 [bacterium]|nr:hypothetical protein [bacterium]